MKVTYVQGKYTHTIRVNPNMIVDIVKMFHKLGYIVKGVY